MARFLFQDENEQASTFSYTPLWRYTMRSFKLVPTVNPFTNLTAVVLLAALAAAVMLPAEADAYTSQLIGYKFSTNHVTEGNTFSVTIERVNDKAGSGSHSTAIYTEARGQSGKGYDVATSGTDYTAYSQTHTFSAVGDKVTFTIPTTQDDTIEGDESFAIVVQPGGSGKPKSSVYPRILNDDVATITISNQSVNEGGTMTFTAKHTGKTGGFGFTMTPSYTNGTAESGDYNTNTSGLSFSGTLNETKTFTVSTVQDATLEENETFTVGFTTSGNDIPKGASDEIRGQTATGTINNDDSATVTVNNASASEGDDITFTISLNNAVEGGLTVTPSYTNGTASSSDYTQNTSGVSFTGTASETQTFTVSTTEDTDIEDNETFTVGLSTSNAPSGVTSTDTGTGTINDDETKPYVVVNSASVDEGDSGTTDLTFTARLVNSHGHTLASKQTVTAGYSVLSETGNTATAGTDYTTRTGTITFAPDETSKTIDVSVTGDETVEADETLTWKWTSWTNSILASYTYTGTIKNDDSATLTINDASASEGDSLSFTVTLSEAVQGGLTVTPTYTNGAAASSDYTAYASALSFSGTKGETKSFKVATKQDAVFEGNETFTVGLSVSNAPSGITSTDTGKGTINNDDSATLTINDASADEGGDMTFTVTLSEKVQGGLTVTPSYTNGTAASGDYKANTNALSFSGDKGETKDFRVTTTDDEVLEANETFTVGLSVSDAPSGITSTDTGTGTINNDDSATVTVNDASASEGDSLTFTVTLSEAVQGGLTVTPDFSGGTAVEGTDYDENTAALSFSGTKGETETFKVATTEDAALESNETFTVGLTVSNAPSGVTDTDVGTGTINNDDSAEVTVNDAEADEGDDITFTVTLSQAVQGGLTVTPDFTDVTAVEGTDYDENTSALTFTGTKGETKTFTVSTDEDAILESDETFTVGLTASGAPAGTSVTDTDTGAGTIDNDDGATVTVNNASASEGNSITFTVTLGAAVQGGLTVTPDFTDVTAVEGTDYDENTAALSFSGTANETKTFTVSTDEDAILESDETFTVGLTASGAPSGTSVTDTDVGTGTINNDDSANVTVNNASASEGNSMTFTVTLSAAVQGGLTVTPGYTNGTASNNDYTKNTSALSFSGTANETKTFTVSTTEDAVLEANETFSVGLTATNAPTGTSVTDTDTGTGTINNDDSAAVTINDANADEGDAMTFTVTLSAAVQGGLTVTPGYTNGTAASGDYTKNTSALSFSGAKGETKTFTVSTTEDAVLEANETFTVGLSASNQPTGTSVTSSDTGTGTINNDDGATVTVNDTSASEGESMTFRVTLGAAVQGGLTVTPGYTNGTAANGDYTKNVTGISFSGTKGETKSFTVSTKEDAVLEADETFTVSLSVSNAPLGVTFSDTGTGTIDNDDATEVTVNDANADEGNTMTFTVTLSEAVQGGLTVTPGYTNGTAANGDYTKNTSAISFSGTKGEQKTFTVSTKEDDVVESNETFAVGLTVSKAPSGVTSTDTGTGTINNDDGATVTVNNASASEGDGITFTITLGANVQDGLTVTPGYTNGTAASTDYTANTSAVSFTGTKGETQTFTVSTTEDGVFEADETFTVSLTVSKSGINATDTGTGTINNDDSAEVTINDDSENEGGDLSFTVSLDNDVQGGLTVSLQYGGTALGGTDYTAHVKPLDFSGTKGETKSFTVSTIEDEIVEGNESITIALSVSKAPPGVTSTDTGTGTIEDDDTATVSIGGSSGGAAGKLALSSTIDVAGASAAEGEALTFTVTLDKAVVGGCSVTPVYTNVTAAANDYVENVGEIAFSGTAGEQKTFTVSTTQDAVVEHDETFEVGVTVSGTTLDVVAPGGATGTIENDDSAEVTVDDARADEGDDLTFTVSLDNAVQDGLTVTPGYANGTADASDYAANTSALRFRGWAGETKTITVATVEDAMIENDEAFTLSLAVSNAPDGITYSDTGAGTIDNDDGATVTINNASASEGESLAFTVSLGGAVQGGLTVTPVYTDGTAEAGDDYTAETSPIAFNGTAGETRTLTVATAQDTSFEGDETFTVGLKVSKSGLFATDTGAGTIVDDETDDRDDSDKDDPSGGAALTISNASAAEGEALTFTVTLNKAVAGGLTATPTFTDGTAEEGADYTAGAATIAFSGTAGETGTFSVDTIQDAEVEGDETFSVGLTLSNAPSGVTAGTATGTIVDEDGDDGGTGGGATVTIADTSAAEGEALSFTVTLNKAVAGGLTVTPAYTNGTAADGDYTKNASALTFSGTAGETQTFAVATVEDEVIENDETFTVDLTLSNAPSGVTAGTATGTIVDDDGDDGGTGGGATLTIADTSATEGEALTFTLTLNRAVANGLTVTPVYTDVTTSNGSDYVENATALTFSGTAGEQHAIVVPTVDDDLIEDRETFTLSLTVSNAPSGVTAGTAVGAIEDDDMAAPPLAPDKAPTLTPLSNTRLRVTWTAVAADPAVIDYDVRYRVAGSDGDFTDAGYDGTGTSVVLEGLLPGTAYEVQVRAVNAEGAGPWSTIGEELTHVNSGPIALGAIPDQVLTMGADGSVRVERYFEDPDEDPLTFATAAEGRIVRVSISGGSAKLVPLAVGAASVAVTATDPFGLSARQFFSVTVEVDQGERERALKLSLAAFGRTVASQAVDAVSGRFDASSREARATVGGQGPEPGTDGAMTWIHGAVRLMDRDGVFNAMDNPATGRPNRADEPGMALPNGRDLVTRSSFNLSLERNRAESDGGAQAAGGWMLWGHGAHGAFTGTPESDLSLDGRVSAAYVGVDRLLCGNALAGLALSHSNGTIDHAGASVAGRVKARVTSVHPYAHWSPREGTELWGLLGFGLGDAEMDTDDDNVKTDIGMAFAAVGGSNALTSLGAVDLSVKGDAFLASVGADAVERLGEVRGGARRVRLMLEGESETSLSSDTRLTPGLGLGVRADGGTSRTASASNWRGVCCCRTGAWVWTWRRAGTGWRRTRTAASTSGA